MGRKRVGTRGGILKHFSNNRGWRDYNITITLVHLLLLKKEYTNLFRKVYRLISKKY